MTHDSFGHLLNQVAKLTSSSYVTPLISEWYRKYTHVSYLREQNHGWDQGFLRANRQYLGNPNFSKGKLWMTYYNWLFLLNHTLRGRLKETGKIDGA